MMIAPSLQDVVQAIIIFLFGPLCWIASCIILRRKPLSVVFWSVPFFAFYGYLITDEIPATSAKRTDVVILIKDSAGRPLSGVRFDITHFRIGPGHFAGHLDEVCFSDSSGQVTVITKSNIRLDVTFKKLGYRYASVELDRIWGNRTVRDLRYTWGVRPEAEKEFHSNVSGVASEVRSERKSSLTIVIPSDADDDHVIQKRMREILPPRPTPQ